MGAAIAGSILAGMLESTFFVFAAAAPYAAYRTFKAPAGYSGYRWVVIWRDQPKHGLGRPVCLGPVAWDLGKSTCTPPKSVSAKTGR